jgi:hypothetical protein
MNARPRWLVMSFACLGLTSGMFSDSRAAQPSAWCDYGERYAIVVMGGNVSGQIYRWYWGDTGGMYRELISYGFSGESIYFLSYGDSANAHPDWVDATSTTANIITAYAWAQANCTDEDLLYIYWVDHGSPTEFVTYDGSITHAQLGTLMVPIHAKQILGAYNPCYSGAVIDDISREGVITITSQDATHTNSWGWAGMWRRAFRNDPADLVDTNLDGYVSMTEAYNWIAPQSQAAGEHSMLDDNGDRVGHEWGTAGYDPLVPGLDGYNGNFYSLDGWLCDGQTVPELEEQLPPTTSWLRPNEPNPFGLGTTICYHLPASGHVNLVIYDSMGHRIRQLTDMRQDAGEHSTSWDGTDDRGHRVAGAVYFCHLTTSLGGETRKILLVE